MKGNVISVADIGQRVVVENDRGAVYGGVVKALSSSGVIVACDEVDLGYGWEPEHRVMAFRQDQVRRAGDWLRWRCGPACVRLMAMSPWRW